MVSILEVRELFHGINAKRKIYFNQLLELHGLNFMELEILAFLHEQPHSNTFTQIIRSKDYAKSHISTAINHLVDCGYLAKECAPNNKKIYHLHLLEKSHVVIEGYTHCAQSFQNVALSGIAESDLEIFQQVVTQINKNLMQD